MRFFWLLLLAITTLLGCHPEQILTEPPVDRPYYPSALLQNADTLYVVSSNFDQRYNHATVLSVDLGVVDTKLANGTDSNAVVGSEAVTSSGFIPSLAAGATFSPAKNQIFFMSRAERTLRVLPLVANKIACGAGTLGQDCYSGDPALSLVQNNPYFLVLNASANGQDIVDGFIGYPLNPATYKATTPGIFMLPERFELERFTWNATTLKAEIADSIAFGNLFNVKLDPNFQTLNQRTIVKLGAMIQSGGELFTLFDSPTRSVILARMAIADLQVSAPDPKKIALYEVGMNSSIHMAGPIAIRQDGTNVNVFATNERPGVLLKLVFPSDPGKTDASGNLTVSLKSEVVVCDFVNDLKLSPDNKKLVVACGDGKIVVYDAASLEPLTIDPAFGAAFGRAPANILFDERSAYQNSPFRFYTANFHDGSVSVYDLYSDAQAPNSSLLKAKGRIFTASLPNREGGN